MISKENTNFLNLSSKEKDGFKKVVEFSINNNPNLPLNDSWGVNMILFLDFVIHHKLNNTYLCLDIDDKKRLLQYLQNTNFEDEKLKQKLLNYCLNLNNTKQNRSF